MIHLEPETGLTLSVGCICLLSVVFTANLLLGNYLIATFNFFTLALGFWVLVRWVEIRENRRRLERI